MSGIGCHEYSKISRNIYDEPEAICPYCGQHGCRADFCDVGVGLVQIGPFFCQSCGSVEIGAYDKKTELSDREAETGWYAPNRDYPGSAPTFNGRVVNNKDARMYYELGLLDKKGE